LRSHSSTTSSSFLPGTTSGIVERGPAVSSKSKMQMWLVHWVLLGIQQVLAAPLAFTAHKQYLWQGTCTHVHRQEVGGAEACMYRDAMSKPPLRTEAIKQRATRVEHPAAFVVAAAAAVRGL
jgi:hypothetical protein